MCPVFARNSLIMSEQQADQYREKFRPDNDSSLDSEVEAALGGLSVDEIVAQGPQQPRNQSGGEGNATKRGKVNDSRRG